MEGGGDGMDRLSGLVPPIIWNIFSRFDLPELTDLKLVCPRFRNVIESDPFARYYNRREVETPSWTVLHLFRDQVSVCGVAVFVRDSDGREITFELEPLLDNGAVYPAAKIRLLCVKGSLMLFRVPLPCNIGGFEFVAINPFSQQVIPIPVPENCTFFHREQFILSPDPDHDFEFLLSYAYVVDQTPRVREYNSFTHQWSHVINGIVGDNELPLETDDPRNVVIFQQNWIYFMAFIPGLWQPEFQLNAVEDLFDFQSTYLDVAAAQSVGLIPSISFHFVRGGSGYAIVILRGIVPGGDRNIFYVKNVFLYRLNRSGTDIELVSTIPQHLLPTSCFFCGSIYYIEVTNGYIKYAIPAMVPNGSLYLLFTFNLADEVWSFESINVDNIYRFPNPDFTSRLTIRC